MRRLSREVEESLEGKLTRGASTRGMQRRVYKSRKEGGSR